MSRNVLIVEDEFIGDNDLRQMLTKAGYVCRSITPSAEEARRTVEKQKPGWVLLNIMQDSCIGIEIGGYLSEKNIGFIYISANTDQKVIEAAKATEPYGFLVKPFREKDLLIMLDIAMGKHQQNLLFIRQRDMILQKELGHITDRNIDVNTRISKLPTVFQSIIPFDYFKVSLPGRSNGMTAECSFLRAGFDEYQIFRDREILALIGMNRDEIKRIKISSPAEKSQILNDSNYRKSLLDDPVEKHVSHHFNLSSRLILSMVTKSGERFSFSFYSRKSDAYFPGHLNTLLKAEQYIVEFIEQVFFQKSYYGIAPQRHHVPISLVEDISPSCIEFDGIIGKSQVLLQVLDHIRLVGPSPVSVLILGESGTGKEKVARCIHQFSPRKSKPFITVNCAALPADLIESELFGHEKGAFTGAAEKRIGKFELANGGTIFLDEVGELTLEAQIKLLRVLQEKEIERVGGSRTIRVDVRVVAATNKKLEKEVTEDRFRLDLYYRLNVFPVVLPALRDRKDDIPLLTDYFLKMYSKEIGKEVNGIAPDALKALIGYSWPGNIRELQHTIERSLLLNSGDILSNVFLSANSPDEKPVNAVVGRVKTLELLESEHILCVLRGCNGKVCGPSGAAELLGVPPSTLNSKIKKLGISRESYFNH